MNDQPDETARQVLGANIAKLMKSEGRESLSTNTRLFEASGIAVSTISRLIHGKTACTLDNVAKLASAFNVEVWQMLLPDLDVAHPQRLITKPEADLIGQVRQMVAKQAEQTHGNASAPVIKSDEATRKGLADRVQQHKDFGSPYDPTEETNAERDTGKKKGD